jgi:hypothetical protein
MADDILETFSLVQRKLHERKLETFLHLNLALEDLVFHVL